MDIRYFLANAFHCSVGKTFNDRKIEGREIKHFSALHFSVITIPARSAWATNLKIYDL